MIDVFICHAAADREVAAGIAARLERTAEARVLLDEIGPGGDQNLTTAWDAGLGCNAVLLLLSPDSTPGRRGRQPWEPILNHVTRNAGPPLASILLRPCPYPPLLERKLFFRWADDPREVLRSIQSWTVSLHPQPEQPAFLPAALPWFEDRQQELNLLWETLVDDAGIAVVAHPTPGIGKTSLAQTFAHRAGACFRDILWVGCKGRSAISVAGDLAAQFGVPLEGPPLQAWEHLIRQAGRHRLLVVLDDLDLALPLRIAPEGCASLLVTAQSAYADLPSKARLVAIASQSLPPQVLPPCDPPQMRLWRAMSVCRPDDAPLELAAQVAELKDGDARMAAEQLAARRLVCPLDEAGTRYRLTAATDQDHGEEERRRHAEVLSAVYSKWTARQAQCSRLVGEFPAAFRWASATDWSLAASLAGRVIAFLQAQRRDLEAAEILEETLDAARQHDDSRTASKCLRELSWILDYQDGRFATVPVAGEQLNFDFGGALQLS